jgi:hypothetical protein
MPEPADPEVIKYTRTCLRMAEAHDLQTALDAGAQHETVNMVEVVHHPTSALPGLNYMTPRRGAAWVTARAVQEGMAQLAALGRAARIVYYDGLMPDIFRQTLLDCGLQWSSESAVYANSTPTASLPQSGYLAGEAADIRAIARWWQTRCILLAGGQAQGGQTPMPRQLPDLVENGRMVFLNVMRSGELLGVASLQLQMTTRTAKVTEFHLSDDTPDARRLLIAAAARAAARRSYEMIYTAEALGDAEWLSGMNFMKVGHVVVYSAARRAKDEVDERLAQSLRSE